MQSPSVCRNGVWTHSGQSLLFSLSPTEHAELSPGTLGFRNGCYFISVPHQGAAGCIDLKLLYSNLPLPHRCSTSSWCCWITGLTQRCGGALSVCQPVTALWHLRHRDMSSPKFYYQFIYYYQFICYLLVWQRRGAAALGMSGLSSVSLWSACFNRWKGRPAISQSLRVRMGKLHFSSELSSSMSLSCWHSPPSSSPPLCCRALGVPLWRCTQQIEAAIPHCATRAGSRLAAAGGCIKAFLSSPASSLHHYPCSHRASLPHGSSSLSWGCQLS